MNREFPGTNPQNDSELLAIGEALLEESDRLVGRWHEEVEREVCVPWREAARLASERHAWAREALLADKGSPADRLIAYRESLANHVLGPLGRMLDGLHGSARVGEAADHLRTRLRTLGAQLPEWCEVDDPTERYLPLPEDGAWPRWWKRWIRTRRSGGAVGRWLHNRFRRVVGQAPMRSDPIRRVPLRALWGHHVDGRLSAWLFLDHEAIQRGLAGSWQTILQTGGRVVEALLTEEHRHRRVERHLWDTGPEGDGPGQTPGDVETLRAHLVAFQEALEAAATLKTPAETGPVQASAVFSRVLVLAGTPILPWAWRARRGRLMWPTRLEERGREWRTWERHGVEEWTTLIAWLRFRREVLRLEAVLLDRLYRQTLKPLRDSTERIGILLREAHARIEASPVAGDQPLGNAIRAAAESTVRSVERTVDLTGLSLAEQALNNLGRGEDHRIQDLIADLPDEVGQIGLSAEPDVDPTSTPVPWSPRDAARQAYEPPIATLIREEGRRFRNGIVEAWAAAHQIPHVIDFSCDAAFELLDSDPSEEDLYRAREVAGDGFLRAAESLDQVVNRLREPWARLTGAVVDGLGDNWSEFHQRVRRATVEQARWRGMGSVMGRQVWRWWQLWRHWLERQSQEFAPRIRWARARFAQLISRGQAAVGTARPTEEGWRGTLQAIDQAEETLRALPMVYRRLFAYDPTDRRQLLGSRSAALREATDFISRWESGAPGGPLLIEGMPGVGRTSFLEVLADVIERDDVHRVGLTERCDADQFAQRVGETLGWNTPTLDRLEQRIGECPVGGVGIVMVDDLEYLFLHTLGGADSLEQVLAFLSRTDSRVCWILTLNEVAGPILRSELRLAIRSAYRVRLDRLDRDGLEQALLQRHRWSGLGLVFEPPAKPGFLVRRRLRQAGTVEETQRLLRSIWLDRVERLAGGDPAQAILCWLRSMNYEEGREAGQGKVVLHPCPTLDTRFLTDLPLTHTMTLRALLAHGSLAVEEHARVFRLPDPRSALVLEHLLSLRLIEPRNPGRLPDQAAVAGVQERTPYRIRPSLRQAVLQHLRGANMLPHRTP